MTTKSSTPTEADTGHQRDTDAVEKRVNRALGSIFHVEEGDSAGKYTVHSNSGNVYTVTMPDGTCTCPDGQRGRWCKHAHRVAFVTGELPDIDGVRVVDDGGDDETDGKNDDETDDEDGDTFAERVEQYAANNPGASAIEVIGQLEIDPSEKGRVEEILA